MESQQTEKVWASVHKLGDPATNNISMKNLNNAELMHLKVQQDADKSKFLTFIPQNPNRGLYSIGTRREFSKTAILQGTSQNNVIESHKYQNLETCVSDDENGQQPSNREALIAIDS